MIDLRLLRDDPERVRASQRARGDDEALVGELLAADERRRAAVSRADQLRAESNAASKAIQSAGKGERPALIDKARALKEKVREVEVEQAAAEQCLRELHLRVPNVVADDAPPGGEDDYVVLEEIGLLPSFDFEVADHLEVGQRLGAIDMDRGAKVSGARFYFLTGPGALLEIAMWQLGLARAVAAGFTPVVPPALVRPEAMEGTGFLGAHAGEIYHLADDDLYLVGTSEVPLAAYHMDEVLDAAALPLRYAGFSACFRREAGSYGKDTRGIIRVHQFHKVEMFSFCRPDDAAAEHARLLAVEKQLLADLGLPFRVIDVAAGDLGTSAARKYDCEAWVPSQGRYREVTSASNCTTYQARRLGTRYRTAGGIEPVATLNGTLVTTRWLVPLLEVNQQADGSVRVPEPLRPYLGGREVLEPAS
ncbi:MAG: serine--tRNA ligase [Frankiaceae bacterium]